MNLRTRFWLESILGLVTAALAALTAVVPAWVEEVFGVDPDGHSGVLEWAIVLVLLALALALALTLAGAARRELARAQ
jgi:predicted lysophospholipase L1 biosynthesis ABC-type transport system permease subunit